MYGMQACWLWKWFCFLFIRNGRYWNSFRSACLHTPNLKVITLTPYISFLIWFTFLGLYRRALQFIPLHQFPDYSWLLGMDHPRECRGVACGNPGNTENPESQDTCINMPISTHSSVLNLLDSSAHRSTPNRSPTVTTSSLSKFFICYLPLPNLSLSPCLALLFPMSSHLLSWPCYTLCTRQ